MRVRDDLSTLPHVGEVEPSTPTVFLDGAAGEMDGHGPALGHIDELVYLAILELHARVLQQRRGRGEVQGEIVRADLDDSALGAKPRHRQLEFPAAREGDLGFSRHVNVRCPDLASSLTGDAHALPAGEHHGMLIALLAVLGVDLIVIVVLLGATLTRRRWVSHQPGAFKGAIRVVEGEVSGLGGTWTRGYGRWVRDVLVWTKAPLLLRNELLAVDGPAGAVRPAEAGDVKRLGSHPVIVPLLGEGGARVEIAAAGDDRARARGPVAAPAPSPSDGRHEPPPQPLR